MADRLSPLRVFLITALTIMLGCSGLVPGKQAYAVFIDYTQSASTFHGDNPAKIKQLLQHIANEMEPKDVFEVYPIHAYTESATPLVRLNGPPLKGDLRDRQRLKLWKETVVVKALSSILDMDFRKDRTSSTNIYPIVRKISRLQDNGFRVKAYLVCDMIQDFHGEDFSVVFSNRSNIDPVAVASQRVSELGFQEFLRGVEIVVMIPGSPYGSRAYDQIRAKVNAFWDQFLSICGADLLIQDL